MKHSVIMSGFGGQGILMMGRLLAHAAMRDGLRSIWIPSYTPEMRHGVADCFVVVASSPIGELSLRHVDTVIIMSEGALRRHLRSVRRGGAVIVDTSMVTEKVEGEGKRVYEIEASKIADELFGTSLLANMVVLGFFLELTKVVRFEAATSSVAEVLPSHRRSLVEVNRRALEEGRKIAKGEIKFG